MNSARDKQAAATATGLAVPAGLALPLEVRVHGRGGQGGVTCAKLIAVLYTQMGLQVQTFGDYGSERAGAPVQAFTRVDRLPIRNHNKIYRPDHLIVLDEGLLGPTILAGARAGGLLLLNSHAALEAYAGQYADYRLGVIDATAIAREHGIGSSSVVIINTTMLGAYARLLGISHEVLEHTFAVLGLGEDLAAAEHAWERLQLREPAAGRPAEAAGSAAPAPVPVAPLSEHRLDFPADIKTGSWSNQVPAYVERGAPCNGACPAGNDVVGFVRALRRDAAAAAGILLRSQPLPSVCGRVCPAPCMTACNRAAFDGAVNIRGLERWIGDHAVAPAPVPAARPQRRVAIVGGGPAGLGAAWELACAGHAPTLYEAAPVLGGVLASGIPRYRLPEAVLQRDVERILGAGADAQCGRRIGRDDLARLAQEYDAVLVCIGFGAALRLGVAGEALGGIEQGLDFLARARQGPVGVQGHVVVVGGGNTAMDCARSALRCGAAAVTVVCREGDEDMPAIAEEVDGAEAEGVRFLRRRQPLAFTGDGRVAGATLGGVEPGPPDAAGRPGFVATAHAESIACDHVIVAIGQGPQVDWLPPEWRAQGSRAWRGSEPLAVWLAGDCASGDGTVAHAIGHGRQAAREALAALAGAAAAPADATGPAVAPGEILISHFDAVPPQRDRQLAAASRRAAFDEVNLGLAGPEEAHRCFSCGHCTHCDTCLVYCPEGVIARRGDGYVVDAVFCKGCGMCVAECPRGAMEMGEKGRAPA